MLDVLTVLGFARASQFGGFFLELVEDARNVRPLEACGSGFVSNFFGFDQSGKVARDSFENGGAGRGRFLLFLDFIPAQLYIFRSFGMRIAEDVRMSANEFLVDGVE